MNNAVITIKTDSKLKNQAMKIANDLGFSLSSLINAYLKHFTRTKTVDFTLNEEIPSDWMIKQLAQSKADIKSGRVVSFNTIKEELDYLNKIIDEDESKIRKKICKTTKKGSEKHQDAVPSKKTYLLGQSI
jgi:addiction module RelB/DinJ family antitoxin